MTIAILCSEKNYEMAMAIIFGMINFWWQTLMVTLLNSNIVAKPQKSAPCKNMESKSGGKSLFMRWHRSGQTAGCIGIVLKPLITQCPGSSSVVKNFSFDKICTLEWIGHWGQAIISQPPLYAHCHQHHRHHFHKLVTQLDDPCYSFLDFCMD